MVKTTITVIEAVHVLNLLNDLQVAVTVENITFVLTYKETDKNIEEIQYLINKVNAIAKTQLTITEANEILTPLLESKYKSSLEAIKRLKYLLSLPLKDCKEIIDSVIKEFNTF